MTLEIQQSVSKNIRRVREARKLTLDAAAAVTGVSRSMLAQIEKGDVNPTISVLWKIANGYKTSFTSLVAEERPGAELRRAGIIPPIVADEGRYVNHPAFPFDDGRGFETYRIVIAPGGSLEAQPHLTGTEEYVTVFSGMVDIWAGEERFSLEEGDSLRFRADVPHGYRNAGETEAQLSMLIYYSK